jgi:type III pantothenate kinase
MLLLADVGNTNITLGIYNDKDELLGKSHLMTKTPRTSHEYGAELLKFLHLKSIAIEDIEAVVISSVVPDIMKAFNSAVCEYVKKEPFIVNADIKTGISLKIDCPDELGADRLVDAVAAYYTYGGPVLVVDFGTATTYDVITDKGEFLGGVIAPGLEICAEALWKMANKLPKISLEKPESILGKNTVNSMQAGVIYGYMGQVEYIIKNLKETQYSDLKVVATGGLAQILKNNTDAIDIYDEELAFKGLKHIYYKNR